VVATLANRQQGIGPGMSRNDPLRSELTEVCRLSGAKLSIPTELPAGCRQFLHLTRPKEGYPQNSKSLPAGSNSSKRGLTIRGMFTPLDQTWE
jgi:hypothetical protein